ncbi:MAG: hypothetical protein A4E37_01081 [Methanoregulaceae archaeon PtaB.Bin056]|nr:MAG: hypothetical protein A4E37_01081 [Methanoregulaceae archaeon PtaB.Bin056]
MDESFDAVASTLAFSCLKNPGRMPKEAWRGFPPGRRLAIWTPGKISSPQAFGR